MKKTILFLVPAIISQAAGNVLLSMAMKGMAGDLLAVLPRLLADPGLWLGTALLALSFILFAATLSWADLSFVIPAISAEVAVNVLFAKVFLHEFISPMRWAGILFICLGVFLVMRSERKKQAVVLGGAGR